MIVIIKINELMCMFQTCYITGICC